MDLPKVGIDQKRKKKVSKLFSIAATKYLVQSIDFQFISALFLPCHGLVKSSRLAWGKCKLVIYSAANAIWEMSCCTLKEQQEQLYARFGCFSVDGDKIEKVDEVNCWELSLYSSVTKFPLCLTNGKQSQ